MSVTQRIFGELSTGGNVLVYHLENKSGAYAEVLQYGAILAKLVVPDRNGTLTDVVLGYDKIAGYETNGCYFGATIGRNCNRIENAKFFLNGREIVLPQNEQNKNLHSGPDGFEKKLWECVETNQHENSVTFLYNSPDGEQGFPGEFRVNVKYEFTEENELRIYYQGIAEDTTVANMTNHSYFNLAGEGSGDVRNQELMIHAKYYTPVRDSASIPTGEYSEVAGTPMDFNTAKKIGQDIDADFEQLQFAGGYDHNYVTDGYAKGIRRKIASAYCEETGIAMDVTSDCPCVQFYAGNFVENEKGKNGHVYEKRHGFCLETQVEPNAVNVENFHSPILEDGETYRSVTSYRFFVK